MKKTTVTITTLGLLAILLCWLVIHLSCNQDVCRDCELSADEAAFICYTKDLKLLFKNDQTNAIDTLSVTGRKKYLGYCSDPCSNLYGSSSSGFDFFHLNQGWISIGAMSPGGICFDGSIPNTNLAHIYNFILNVPLQAVSINNKLYHDAYVVQTDSIVIDSYGSKQKVPWKIVYSRSEGFVRFYMVNGQTWSKL